MNAAHYHLSVNHFPLIFPVLGIIIMLIGLIFKSEAIKRTAYFVFILTALASFLAISTGGHAEEMLEKGSEFSKQLIHEHEEIAEVFAIWTYVLAVLSLIGFVLSLKLSKFSDAFTMLTILVAISALYFARRTATTGGEIRHVEIREKVIITSETKKN